MFGGKYNLRSPEDRPGHYHGNAVESHVNSVELLMKCRIITANTFCAISKELLCDGLRIDSSTNDELKQMQLAYRSLAYIIKRKKLYPIFIHYGMCYHVMAKTPTLYV